MNIQVKGEVERLIQSAVASGQFSSAEDVLAAMASAWSNRECVRELAEKTNTEESALDAFSRLGVVGCMKNGARDLATNPGHMEGFGR